MVIIDARSGKYDDGRRIPGAGNLAANASPEEVARLVKSKDQLVVTYCSNPKCPASGMLADNLRKQGYKNVIEYPFGIQGWAAAGNKTSKAGE
jgi:rhodanese-related sulfurtransferase